MSSTMNSEKRKRNSQPNTSHSLVPGSLCWSQLDGHPWWPAMFIGGRESGCPDCGAGKTWVYWFGEHRISKVKVDKTCPFAENFIAKWTKRTSKGYNKAVLECCKMHAKTMLHDIDRWQEERCLKWAEEGFPQKALQGERECTWPKGIPPSIQKVVDEINKREAAGSRRVYGNRKLAASANDLSEVTKPCVEGMTRCDEILGHQRVTLLSFNDHISPVLLPKLGFNVTRRLVVNQDVDALPVRAKLLGLGPIDIFIGGASSQETQADSLCRNLFECYRIVTVLQESNNDLQWIFYAPLDVSQEFKETANRFFTCKGVMLKNRIANEQFLLWNNMPSLGKLTTGMKI